jgi:hypothetical protein
MADPLRLAALAQTAIVDATARLVAGGSLAAWEREMRAVLARSHTAAWLAATAERLHVPLDSPLLSERRLSRAERAEIAATVEEQLQYLKGFVQDMHTLTPAQIAARANLYAGATRKTYYGARWGDWEIPSELLPGNQQCQSNCRCAISVADNGGGKGTLTREMGGTEHHCTECPPLVGSYPVQRRAAA